MTLDRAFAELRPEMFALAYRIVGNRAEMDSLLAEPASLGDLKRRQQDFQLQVDWQGAGELSLPAYDSTLDVAYARG